MKMVYISSSIIPSTQANSVHVMKMAQAFSDNNIDITLIGRNGDEKLTKDLDVYSFYGVKKNFNIIKHSWLNKIGNLTYSFLSLIDVLLIKPSLVYGRYLIGVFLASLFGFDTIYEIHEPYHNQNIFKRFIFRRLITNKNFQGVVVISEVLKKMLLETEMIASSKIFVAHDGSDLFNLQNKVKLDTSKRNVGYVGHLYKGRGIDLLIQLSKQLPDINFHIIGGNEHDINYWKRMVCDHNIIFHGYVAPSKVYKYRNACDVLLAPYQNEVTVEGFNDTSQYMSPMKIFEYMSSNTAIISSDLPVLREVLNEKNALLVKCDDINAWIKALKKLNEKKLSNKLAKRAYNDFQMNYLWKNRARNILKRFDCV